MDEYYNNTQVTRRQYMRYHGDLLFKIIDGLTANAQFVYETNHNTVEWNATQDSHVMRTMRNAYYYQSADGTIKNYVPTTGGLLRTTNSDGRYWTARGQLNYAKTFGKHDIMAIAGLEFRETKLTGSKALMLGYDDQLQTSSTHTIDLGTLSTMNYSPLSLAPQVVSLQASLYSILISRKEWELFLRLTTSMLLVISTSPILMMRNTMCSVRSVRTMLMYMA